MSRPVVTAIMLSDLLRAGAEIRLSRGALLTPAAKDWLKEHAVPVTWEEPGRTEATLAAVLDPQVRELRPLRAMLDRRGGLAEIIEPVGGAGGLVPAVRRLCGKIARGEVLKGVVFAADGAVAVCVANKHNRVRAALGTDLPAVEHACRELGINVLVIEHDRQTTFQMRQMIDRLVRGPTSARPELAASLEVIEQGGGRADW